VRNSNRIDQKSILNTGTLLSNICPSTNPGGLLSLPALPVEPATDHILAQHRQHYGNEILENTAQLSVGALKNSL
jgi:hypothetical protein